MKRAQTSLSNICPAVLNGGFTTFLALVVMVNSNTHAFQIFFKVFFLTVVFGLFHGVIFLPALLSWIGSDNIKENKPDIVFNETYRANKHNSINLSEISEL